MADPGAGARSGVPRGRPAGRRRKRIFIIGGAVLAVLVLIVAGNVAWMVVLPGVNGRGEYTRVPRALSVLEATKGLDQRITSRLEVQSDRGWLPAGGGHYTDSSEARWTAFTGHVQVEVRFARFKATALKSGTDAASEGFAKGGGTRQPIAGLGDEAYGVPVTSGYEVHVRHRNVTVVTSFSAPAKSLDDLKAYARPMAETALALVKEANR